MMRKRWKLFGRSQFMSRSFPELRIFIRSDSDTRFVRIGPWAQISVYAGMTSLVAWSIVSAAVILLDSIGAGNFREQAVRDQQIFQTRLMLFHMSAINAYTKRLQRKIGSLWRYLNLAVCKKSYYIQKHGAKSLSVVCAQCKGNYLMP